jgi:hypothetical protein
MKTKMIPSKKRNARLKMANIQNPREPIPQHHRKYPERPKSHQNITVHTKRWQRSKSLPAKISKKIFKNVQDIQKSYKPLTLHNSLNSTITLHTNQLLTPIPPLHAPKIRAPTMLTPHNILLLSRRRSIITTQNTPCNTHLPLPASRDPIRTEQIFRSTRLHSQRIVRDFVPEGVALVTLEPEGVVFCFAATDDIGGRSGEFTWVWVQRVGG